VIQQTNVAAIIGSGYGAERDNPGECKRGNHLFEENEKGRDHCASCGMTPEEVERRKKASVSKQRPERPATVEWPNWPPCPKCGARLIEDGKGIRCLRCRFRTSPAQALKLKATEKTKSIDSRP
jgi:tRNA(Ile2) C34 agmatinyltransferase TiaS